MGLLQKSNLLADIDMNNPIDQLSKSLNDTISGLNDQIINPLKSTFETASGGVALVSENDSMLTKALSTFKSINIEKISEGTSNLIGGILNNPDLGSIFTYEDGFKVNSEELMRIASQGLGFNIGGVADIKQQLGDSFVEELNSLTGGLTQGLFFADGTKLTIADGYERGMAEALIGFIGRNDSAFGQILNIAGVNSVLNVMIRQAAENAMYQSYDSFKGEYLRLEDYHSALINSMEYCIAQGDVRSLERMLEIIGEDGLNKVRAQYPDLIERTLGGFKFTNETYEEDYPKLRDLLEKLLITVGGNDWYRVATEFGMATNLAVVNNISDDAKLLLSDYDKYLPLLCSAGLFVDEDAVEVFLADFPNAVRFEH